MAGKIQIYNKAVHRTGDATVIVSDNDRSKAKILCDDFFNEALEELAEMHPFRCFLKKELLTNTGNPGIENYKYCFKLPQDCITAVKLEYKIPYRTLGEYLYTNTEKPVLEYAARIKDISYLNASVVSCVALLLASKIAFSLTQDPDVSQNILVEFEEVAFPRAKFNDLRENNNCRPKKYGWATGIVQSSDIIHGG